MKKKNVQRSVCSVKPEVKPNQFESIKEPDYLKCDNETDEKQKQAMCDVHDSFHCIQ